MHQNRWRVGLCLRPHWGAYSAPQTVAGPWEGAVGAIAPPPRVVSGE